MECFNNYWNYSYPWKSIKSRVIHHDLREIYGQEFSHSINFAEELWNNLGKIQRFLESSTPCLDPQYFQDFFHVFTLIRREIAVFGGSPDAPKVVKYCLNYNISHPSQPTPNHHILPRRASPVSSEVVISQRSDSAVQRHQLGSVLASGSYSGTTSLHIHPLRTPP